MSRFRSILFWCHLTVGVCVGVVVLVMSATGVMLAYQKQMTAWADVRALAPHATHAGPALPAATLIQRAQAAAHGAPTAITWRAGADKPVEIAIGRERTLFVEAHTGEVLGEGAPRMRAFMRWATAWHRTLGATGERRALGRAITGGSNLGLLFLVLSGLYLWIPRNCTRAAIRSVSWFRRGLRGKARDFNWHNVIGFWSAIPLAIVVASGVVISYPWASSLVYRVMGEAPPARGGAAVGGERGERGPARERPNAAPSTPDAPVITLDALVETAETRMPDWRSLSLQLPKPGARSVTFSLDAGTGGQPQKRATLTLDASTGRETKFETFAAGTPGRRVRSILRFAHTGEVLGLVGQTIAGLVSLGGVVLVVTGILLSLRRVRTAMSRRQPKAATQERRARAA